jgi:PAS domain S-box-containing protein
MAHRSPVPPIATGESQRKEIGEAKSIRVLVVDDVQENLELLDDVLADGGYAPLLAHNGVQALEVLKKEEVHLVIADAMMPKMDGFQLCKEVRALPGYSRTPFIIYTGNYVDESDQEFARSIGVDRYVVKGTGVGALFEAINDLVQQRYGLLPEPPSSGEARLDDQAFLEQHRALVIKKLEEKMVELEVYARTLERTNREVQASEDRYRALFESASIPIFVLDRATGKVLDVNRQGLDLLGYTREELLGMPHLPFADAGGFARGIIDTSTFVAGETTIRRSDGDVLDVDVGAGPVTRPQDSRLLFYVRDITEQKKMREHLLQAEKMALMGRLAAGIAHEVRNPLAAITLNLQYLAVKANLDAAMLESINNALEGAKRVESVIENTLSLARVSPPVLQAEEVNALVQKVIGFIEMSSRQKDVRVETELGQDLPPVLVDAKQIQQVLINIVQNAIDASPVSATVTISTLRAGGEGEGEGEGGEYVCIAVRDRGPGVPPEQRKYLFQQFRTTKPGGTGLGLVLSRQILERHKGRISLEDAPGGGTVVRIQIPTHG